MGFVSCSLSNRTIVLFCLRVLSWDLSSTGLPCSSTCLVMPSRQKRYKRFLEEVEYLRSLADDRICASCAATYWLKEWLTRQAKYIYICNVLHSWILVGHILMLDTDCASLTGKSTQLYANPQKTVGAISIHHQQNEREAMLRWLS